MTTKKFYLKERNNPQFDKPYYTVCGQLTKKDAAVKAESIYGWNTMLHFDTEVEYLAEIERLKLAGFSVR